MSLITIQCRLVAKASTRQQLWQLMAQKNTPLINELLQQVADHPDFDSWRTRGKISAGTIKKLCEPLKTDSRYIGQPGSFYTSALALVEYIYKSWLKLQKQLQYRLKGQQRWLAMLKSDEELVEESQASLETIRATAKEIIETIEVSEDSSLSNTLFQTFERKENILHRSAIIYLLKNGCRLRQKPEDPKKFAKRRRKTEIKIERLLEKLNGKTPQGRDLTGQKWLDTLIIAATHVPQDEAPAKSWQDILLTRPKSIPFPVAYETNQHLIWHKNEKGRLCVHFIGFSEHIFQIYCDQRQLPLLQRFYQDQEVKKAGKNAHSSALFTLRSARIAWQEGEEKGEAWNVNRLTLHCTLDTRLLTAQGTEQVRQEKAAAIAKILTRMKDKGDLNVNQQAFVKRKQSSLSRINNPFPRPAQPLYQGQTHILVGIYMGLEKPATAAVIDAMAGKAITYRSTKQLLGDKYKLLNRQRRQKSFLSHQCHINQKHQADNRLGESELGQYLDRLLAQAIIKLAKSYQAGSIVLPKLGDIREIVQSEIQVLAEQKIPGYEEAQKRYAKQYGVNVHQWSYGRLMENIKAQAAKVGIVIEESKQSIRGSPQDKAKEIAISAYSNRLNS